MKEFEAHHLAWLKSHPHRSEEWLKQQLKDGFDIHHLDGDHFNNDPNNLVLIEHTDHMRLHGMENKLGRIKSTPKKKSPYSLSRKEDVEKIYNMYREEGTYKKVASLTGLTVAKIKLMVASYREKEPPKENLIPPYKVGSL